MPKCEMFAIVHTTTLTSNVWMTEENNGTYKSCLLRKGKHVPVEWVTKGYIPKELTTLSK